MATDLKFGSRLGDSSHTFFFTWGKRDDASATSQLARPASPWAPVAPKTKNGGRGGGWGRLPQSVKPTLDANPCLEGTSLTSIAEGNKAPVPSNNLQSMPADTGFRAAFKNKLKLIILNGTVVV